LCFAAILNVLVSHLESHALNPYRMHTLMNDIEVVNDGRKGEFLIRLGNRQDYPYKYFFIGELLLRLDLEF